MKPTNEIKILSGILIFIIFLIFVSGCTPQTRVNTNKIKTLAEEGIYPAQDFGNQSGKTYSEQDLNKAIELGKKYGANLNYFLDKNYVITLDAYNKLLILTPFLLTLKKVAEPSLKDFEPFNNTKLQETLDSGVFSVALVSDKSLSLGANPEYTKDYESYARPVNISKTDSMYLRVGEKVYEPLTKKQDTSYGTLYFWMIFNEIHNKKVDLVLVSEGKEYVVPIDISKFK